MMHCARRLSIFAAMLSMLMPAVSSGACAMYTVKPNGTLTTRPAYTLTNGALIKTKDRAPVGATCDTKYKPTKSSGKDIYASYDSTDAVTLCSKAK